MDPGKFCHAGVEGRVPPVAGTVWADTHVRPSC